MLSQVRDAAPFDVPAIRHIDDHDLYHLLIANRFQEARHAVRVRPVTDRVRADVIEGRYQDAICDLGKRVMPQNHLAVRAVAKWPPHPKSVKTSKWSTAPHTLNLV